MLECLILGDSIAVGTKMFAPTECVSYSKGGINSWQWNKKFGKVSLEAETVVISLGTNDHAGVKTEKELMQLRGRIRASRVIWVMPPCNAKFCKPGVNAAVTRVSYKFGDRVVGTSWVQRDSIHPSWRGYKDIVSKCRFK